jgi:hypothetical protein
VCEVYDFRGTEIEESLPTDLYSGTCHAPGPRRSPELGNEVVITGMPCGIVTNEHKLWWSEWLVGAARETCSSGTSFQHKSQPGLNRVSAIRSQNLAAMNWSLSIS